MAEEDRYNIHRFLEAQDAFGIYNRAVSELEAGRKKSHWIWFVFPQLKGLGYSYNSNFYGITCREEAEDYLADNLLIERLRNVCRILLAQVMLGKKTKEILGGIDSHKVSSCLTLFDAVSPNDIFADCLEVCYGGEKDERTLNFLATYHSL